MENRDNMKEKGNGATDVLGELVKQLRIMWIAIFILLAALFVTNSIWIYVFQSYDYVSQDGEGYNYYNREVGGDVNNGTEGQSEEKREIEGN